MRRMTLLLGLAVAAGCRSDAEPAPQTRAADTARVSLGTGDTPHQALPPDLGGTDELIDIGVGVLHLTVRADSIGQLREDTLLIRNAPTQEAAVVARWIHRYGMDWTWEYRMETAEAGLWRNDVEWSYEESGLPIDTVAAEGAWVRVLYALDPGGDARLGWVRAGEGTRTEHWTAVLPEQNLFFRHADSLAFHVEPEGQRVWLDIASGDDGPDYIMRPLRVADSWMQVVVTTPSDYCLDAPVVRSDTVWVRYLDDRGRPRVWYYPRGC